MTGILGGLIGSLVKSVLTWLIKENALVSPGGSVQSNTAAIYAGVTNGNYFVFSYGFNDSGTSNRYFYSSDGTSWSFGTIPATTKVFDVAFNGTTIVIASLDNFYTSTNGTTWTSRAVPGSDHICRDLIWDGSRFIGSFNESVISNLIYSSNGAIWTTIDIGEITSGLAYDGSSRYIATRDASVNTGYTTTSTPTIAGSWSSITFPASRRWAKPIYGNNIWLIFAPGTANYATSTNGTTWTARTLPSNFGNSVRTSADNPIRALFVDGNFYYSFNEVMYKSSNGINWSTDYTWTAGNLTQVAGWAIGTSKIIAVGVGEFNTLENSWNDTNELLEGTR